MSIDPKASYYDAGGIETMEILRAKLTKEQFRGFLLGNLIKYICRYNWKFDTAEDSEKDLNKALTYLNQLKTELSYD